MLNYDGDRAGVQAAKRAIEILLPEDLDVKVLVLPNKSDPDEFIRQQGVGEYQRLRGDAQPHIQFVIDQAVSDRNLHRPAEKAEAVEEVLPYVRAVRNRIQKREYFDIAMDALHIGDAALKRELWGLVRPQARYDAQDVKKKILGRTDAKATEAEMRLLGLLISNKAVRQTIVPRISFADYDDLASAPLFAALIDLEKKGGPVDFDSLSAAFLEDEEMSSLLALIRFEEPDPIEAQDNEDPLVLAERYFEPMRLKSIERRLVVLNSEISTAFDSEDKEKMEQLEKERKELEVYRRRFWLGPEVGQVN